ncbi:MAG TPA: beta-ketoacyl synthase N-terminal-like domain-containing protein, partial [Actinomycetota bacterium]|nr:beta-ketoacyl synthase N-terminal-like domain-containing protein [Actinomycetota bacterium]
MTGTDSGRGAGVAIIGMSCVFPQAPDVDAFWSNILSGLDAVSDPPQGSWDPDLYYDPSSTAPDRIYCKRGGFLGELARFDPVANNTPPSAVGGEP